MVTLKKSYALAFLCMQYSTIIYEQHLEFHFVSNCLELDWLLGWQLWPISMFFPLNWNTHMIKTLFLETEEQLKSILRFTIAFLGLIRETDFLGREANWLIHNSLHQAIQLCLFIWNYTYVMLDGCVQKHPV